MSKHFLYPFRKMHGRIHECRLFQKEKKRLKQKYKSLIKEHFHKNPEGVILVLTPIHSNLGDHAIAKAEINILDQLKIPHLEIPGRDLNELQKYDLLGIMNDHPILINGGGNLGTLWFGVERLMRDIVISNPKSSIMILPNTIHYEDNNWGKEEFNNSQEIYNNHSLLYMYAREAISYRVMKSAYCNVRLAPDVVLSLNETPDTSERRGCLLCMRNDCEKTITHENEVTLRSQVESLFGKNYCYSDTHADGDVSVENRNIELDKKFTEFKTSELVITDRLHGMIFAAITGTPCIVINSKSPKVKGCYEWIKNMGYIFFADDISQISKIYLSIPKCEHKYNNDHLKPYFDELKRDILKMTKGV